MYYYAISRPPGPYMYHYGIMGMHWGVRRFQNEDGTLTSAGRSRYGAANGKGRGLYRKKDFPGATRKEIKAQKVYDRIHSVRDDEERMDRMSKRQLRSLEKAEKYWSEKSKGKKPTERRGLIKRAVDSHRSYDKVERAGRAVAGNVIFEAGDIAVAKLVGKKFGMNVPMNIGNRAKSVAMMSIGEVTVDELLNKALGHF